MGQMPRERANQIANASATGGGDNLHHGDYLFIVDKISYEKGYRGERLQITLFVQSAEKITITEGEETKTPEPNPVNSTFNVIIAFYGKGADCANPNAKAFYEGLTGAKSLTNEEMGEAIFDSTSDQQPARGMLIACKTWVKQVKSDASRFLTMPGWKNIAPFGEGENDEEHCQARIRFMEDVRAKKAA